MNRSISCLLAFAAISLLPALSAHAVNPHLVVMAVNSGADLVAPYDFDPPTMTPGAKGFLIGVDTGDRLPPFPFVASQSVIDLTFNGPGLVHKQGIVNAGELAKFPRIMTRHEADAQSIVDVTNYVPDDTYLIDKLSNSMGWEPVSVGLTGGLASDHFFTINATPNPSGGVANGIYPLAYVVTTSDLLLSGLIERGAQGFDVLGTQVVGLQRPGTAVLDFGMETIRIPEPSSLCLAALGIVGALLFVRRAA